MNWEIILIIGLVIGIVFLLFKKSHKAQELGSLQLWKQKTLTFATPHRIEMILIFLYALLFLWWDVVQNKVLDIGLEYRVTWFGDITTSALDLSIILLIAFHVVLMTLFLLSLQSKKTHRTYDVIVGAAALFGVAIVLAGFVNNIHAESIRFLFIDMSSTSFYHIGVGIEIFAGIYWAFTK